MILFLLACLPPEGPDSRIDCAPAPAHPASASLQDLVDAKVALGLPGLTLGVRTPDGTAIVSAGFADLEDGVVMNPCHVHPMASIGKTWTAAMVMSEVEAGRLAVDDRVADHLDEDVLRRLPNIDRITLHHLLDHGSGLPDFNADIAYIGSEFDRSDDHIDPMHGIDAVRGAAPLFEPGEGYAYTDTAYELLALVLDAATGDRIAATQAEVNAPLGLTQTTQPRPSDPDPAGRVNAYWEIGGGRLVNISDMQSKYDRQVIGAGNVRSTAGDALAFIDGVVHGDLLTEPTRQAMRTPNPFSEDEDGHGYGYGLARTEVDGRVFYGHTGGDVGAGTFLMTAEDGQLSMVGLTNAGMFLGGPLQDVWNEDLLAEVVAAALP